MQAYKLKGKIDTAGNLMITEPVNMPQPDHYCQYKSISPLQPSKYFINAESQVYT